MSALQGQENDSDRSGDIRQGRGRSDRDRVEVSLELGKAVRRTRESASTRGRRFPTKMNTKALRLGQAGLGCSWEGARRKEAGDQEVTMSLPAARLESMLGPQTFYPGCPYSLVEQRPLGTQFNKLARAPKMEGWDCNL